MRRTLGGLVMAAAVAWSGRSVAADAVDVTVVVDEPVLLVGQKTTLRVFGQVDGAIEDQAERIFSWFVDVSNSAPGVVAANWATVSASLSDNVPQTSSLGVSDGAGGRSGVYDTFLGRAGAGDGSPVELLRVEVTAVALGETEFAAAPGTGVDGLATDFLVARDGSGEPFEGGTYGAPAEALVRVVSTEDFLDARTVAVTGGRFEVRFNPVSGRDHRVEWSDDLTDPSWTALPGAPHNGGVVLDLDSNVAERRFYRVVVEEEP